MDPKSQDVGVGLRLVILPLAPLVVLLPARLLWFRDADPLTGTVLGPAVEESLKLAALFLVLTLTALVLPGGRDPEAVLPTWLFVAPWIVGGFYGMVEGVVAYPGQSGLNFTVREIAHGTFLALGLAAALWVWRGPPSRALGIVLGFGTAVSAHILYNALAVLSEVRDATFIDQAVFIAAAAVFAVLLLRREVRQEPGSTETRALVPARDRRLHP